MVAFGFYSPIVVWLNEEQTDGQHTYWLDYAILWALFCVAMIVCRVFTGALSKTRLRFKNPIDPVGGPIVGFLAAWVLASFVVATLHTAPMPKDAFNGALVYNATDVSPITKPDYAWIVFFEYMSKPQSFGSGTTNEFRRQKFIGDYGARRAKFEASDKLIVPRTKS
jgi:hypothetical protein